MPNGSIRSEEGVFESGQIQFWLEQLNSPAFLVPEFRESILLNRSAALLLSDSDQIAWIQQLLPKSTSWGEVWLRINQGHVVTSSAFLYVEPTSNKKSILVSTSLSLVNVDSQPHALCILSPESKNTDNSKVVGLENFPEENPNPVMRLTKDGQLLYANRASRPFLKCWSRQLEHSKGLSLLSEAVDNDAIRYADINCGDTVYNVTFRPIEGSDFLNVYVLDTTANKKTEKDLEIALTELKRLRHHLDHHKHSSEYGRKNSNKPNIIIGISGLHHELLKKIAKVARTDATVLITGETGTGKELIASAIHSSSALKDKVLIKVNCAALPSGLIESELFGHEKGAFTGAIAKKIGRFEQAAGGTIFLDEIGDLPLELQAKLLRVLQEGEMQRVGGDRTIPIDVRVIAATNRVLPELMEKGIFREDLYYRLNVFPIQSLPLRKRKSDIAPLAAHFLEKYCVRTGNWFDALDITALDRLNAYSWPGNVRELENIIERAIILTEGNKLQLDEAFDDSISTGFALTKKTLKQVEQEMIQVALEDSEGRIEGQFGAATKLDMAPSTLRERIKKYGLDRFNQTTNNRLQN